MSKFLYVVCFIWAFVSCEHATEKPKQKEDIRILTGGIKIHFLHHGKGKTLVPGDYAYIEFEGFLAKDSTCFRSTIQQKKPMIYPVGEGTLTQGVEQILETLQEGDEVWAEVPASLGYGSMGVGAIPPNANLLFHIQLNRIFQPQTPPKWNFANKPVINDQNLKVWVIDSGLKVCVPKGSSVLTHFSLYAAKDSNNLSNSYTDGRPAPWAVGYNQFSPGVDQAIQHFGKGAQFRVWVSGEQAFQTEAYPGLKPKAKFFIDIEIIDWKK